MAVTPLSQTRQEAVLKGFNYSVNQLGEDVKLLKSWTACQRHFPLAASTESGAFYKNFLVGCKGSLELAKKKIDAYYTLRSTPIFDSLDPFDPCFFKSKDYAEIMTWSEPTSDNCRVSAIRFSSMENDFNLLGLIRRFIAMIELRIRDDNISAGDYCLVDGNNFRPSDLFKVNPSLIRDAMFYLQEAVPIRVPVYLFINCPPFLETAINCLIKPFFKRKLADRIQVTSQGHEILHRMFSKEIIPKDYGGEAPCLRPLSDDWFSRLENNRDWYVKAISEKTDESQRASVVGLNKVNDSCFGLHGSLKKLCID